MKKNKLCTNKQSHCQNLAPSLVCVESYAILLLMQRYIKKVKIPNY